MSTSFFTLCSTSEIDEIFYHFLSLSADDRYTADCNKRKYNTTDESYFHHRSTLSLCNSIFDTFFFFGCSWLHEREREEINETKISILTKMSKINLHIVKKCDRIYLLYINNHIHIWNNMYRLSTQSTTSVPTPYFSSDSSQSQTTLLQQQV